MHLQYLQFLQRRRYDVSNWSQHQTFLPFLSFEDTSSEGYRGFVPSGQWLRDMFDTFMEEHTADINQHMSMLSGEVCAIDHSHKVSRDPSHEFQPITHHVHRLRSKYANLRASKSIAVSSR